MVNEVQRTVRCEQSSVDSMVVSCVLVMVGTRDWRSTVADDRETPPKDSSVEDFHFPKVADILRQAASQQQ